MRATRLAMTTAALLALAACKPGAPVAGKGPLAAQPVTPGEPLYREIKQWLVGCDNLRDCRAKFVRDIFNDAPDMAKHRSARLDVARQAGPDGRLTLTLAVLGDEAAEKDKAEPRVFEPAAALRLDGKPLSQHFAWRKTGPGPLYSLEGNDAVAFLKAVKDGSLLTFNDGPDAPAISLSGLAAVLLAVDEAQGRLDTPSALARPGSKPLADVPAATQPPVIQPAPGQALDNGEIFASAVRASQLVTLKKHSCDAPGDHDRAWKLNDKEALVVLTCMNGAYQSSSLAFRAPLDGPSRAALLKLDVPRAAQGDMEGVNPDDEAGEYGGADFDPASATFSKIGYARGIGDCGQSAKWVFDGQNFQLLEVRYQNRCGGEPDDWPTLYRAQIVKPT